VQLGRTKVIKHSGGVIVYFRNHLSPNLTQWKKGSHNYYLWLWVNKGAALDLFICVVYVALVGTKHKSESLFQNLVGDIIEVQTLRGIVLLRGEFNAHTTTLLDTIDTNNLCKLLQVPKLAEIKQPGVVAKRQNRDASVNGWGHELLDLCCDAGLLVFNGRTPGDESGEFTCLSNGGITLSIILLAHMQFGKLLQPRSDNR
jgi:hypothetical protein